MENQMEKQIENDMETGIKEIIGIADVGTRWDKF